MDAFTQRVQQHIREDVAERDYHELLDWTTVRRDETDPTTVNAHTTLVLEEPDLPDPSDPPQNINLVAELSDDDERYEDLIVPLEDTLAETATAYLDRVESAASFDVPGELTTYQPTLRWLDSDELAGAVQQFSITVPDLPVDFEPLAEAIADEETSHIDDPTRLTYVSVHSPMYDPTEADEPSYGIPDYTVWYTTENPHEMWGNCDTLEDYAEMVVDNNDEYTVEEVLDWETYTNHFHISGDVESNDIVATYARQAVDDYVAVTDPAFTSTVSTFGMRRDEDAQLWLSGSIRAQLTDMDV